MASDLKAVEDLFSGTWKHVRDENFKESLQALKFPDEEIEFISNAKPSMFIERRGDCIFIKYDITPEFKHESTFKLGEAFVTKDEINDPPTYNTKELVNFKDGALVFKTWSQTSDSNYQTTLTMKGDELHGVMSPIDDTNAIGYRVYKKVK